MSTLKRTRTLSIICRQGTFRHAGPEDIHHVVFDVIPGECGEPTRDGLNEPIAAFDFEYPVEEILLNDAADLRRLEPVSRQQNARFECRDVKAHHGMSDCLRGHNDERVGDEKLVVIGETARRRAPSTAAFRRPMTCRRRGGRRPRAHQPDP